MSETADVGGELDRLVTEWLPLPDVADRLGVPVTRVRQLLAERRLAAVRRGPNAALAVPAAFLDAEGGADGIVKGLPGTLMVLHDAGYTDDEAIRWLFRDDPSLPGSPIQGLRESRGKEVKRRAQALGF
jgi:Rv2175c C-terminal domain of unknown function